MSPLCPEGVIFSLGDLIVWSDADPDPLSFLDPNSHNRGSLIMA